MMAAADGVGPKLAAIDAAIARQEAVDAGKKT